MSKSKMNINDTGSAQQKGEISTPPANRFVGPNDELNKKQIALAEKFMATLVVRMGDKSVSSSISDKISTLHAARLEKNEATGELQTALATIHKSKKHQDFLRAEKEGLRTSANTDLDQAKELTGSQLKKLNDMHSDHCASRY